MADKTEVTIYKCHSDKITETIQRPCIGPTIWKHKDNLGNILLDKFNSLFIRLFKDGTSTEWQDPILYLNC